MQFVAIWSGPGSASDERASAGGETRCHETIQHAGMRQTKYMYIYMSDRS